MRNSEINKVRENNKQIEQLIQKYIEKYKQEGVALENNEQAQKLVKYKIGLCLEIYKVEFQENECVGKQEINFIKQNYNQEIVEKAKDRRNRRILT